MVGPFPCPKGMHMPIDYDPDFIGDMFMTIMFNNWSHDEMAYMHISIMHEE
jgi:hypothetical protein